MALNHNVEMKNADISISQAKEQEREAYTNYFPTVSAMGMGMNSNKHFLNMEIGQFCVQMVKDGILDSVSVPISKWGGQPQHKAQEDGY